MRKSGIVFLISASLCMTACGSTVPELTEEQNAQVVEYAAGLLLKYDQNYQGRLVEVTEEQLTEEQSAEEPQVQEQIEEQEASLQEEESGDETPAAEVSEETTAYSSIDEFYGLDGVSVSYIGFEVKDIYPDSDGEDIFFAMNATEGCKLLVLEFDITNAGGEDRKVDMLSVGSKFKIIVNGEAPRYALTTMLTNDLASYVGTIASGASERVVLIAELPQEEAQSVQSISLVMKNVSEDATISLY